MKKSLLFLVLVALFSMAATPALAREYSGTNMAVSANVSVADTVSIPWREGFESITVDNMMPYGMSMSYRTDGNTNPVYTYTTTQKTIDMDVNTYGNIPYRTARNGGKFASFKRNGSAGKETNSWIFSRGIFLRAGSSYSFSFWYANSSNTASGWMVEAMVGTSSTIEAMKMKIGDSISTGYTSQYQKYEGVFTPEKDGIYYFGLHAVEALKKVYGTDGNHTNIYLSIDDLEIDFGSYKCFASNLFTRNLSNTTAELYRAYTPKNTTGFTLNYRKLGDANWISESIPTSQMSKALSGLVANTSYEARLGCLCEGNTFWSDIITFKTLVNPAPAPIPSNYPGMFPIIENFDGVAKIGTDAFKGLSNVKWYHLDDSTSTVYKGRNKWYIDTLVGMQTRGNIAYISGDGGKTNKYDTTTWTFAHFYTDSFYITRAEEFLLSFDWKSMGEGVSSSPTDYLRVYLLNSNTSIKASSLVMPSASEILLTGTLNNMWKSEKYFFPDTLSGKTKKILFSWVNNNMLGNQPPAAIDNIIFKGLNCGTPKNLQITGYPDDKNLLLSCDAYAGTVTFDLMYRTTPAGAWNIQKGDVSGNTDMKALLLKNLSPETTYEIKVQKRCGTDTSFWSEPTTGRTGIAQVSTINEDFEDTQIQGASIVNGTQINKWTIGSAVSQNSAGKSVYISKDGTANQYRNDTSSIVHFYYDIAFPQTGTTRLSFDWQGIGQSSDFMRVSMVDLSEVPEAGKILPLSGRIFDKDFYNHRNWTHEELIFSEEYAGKQMRLVFTWKNITSTTGVQPSAAIDNLKFEDYSCKIPELKIVGATPSSITLMSDKLENGNSYVLNYRKAETETWVRKNISQADLQNTYLYTLPALASGVAYEMQLRRQCGTDTSAYSSIVTSRTTQELAQIKFVEDFENTTNTSKWVVANGSQENQWTIGTSTANGGQKAAYISNTTTGGYSNNTQKLSTVHLYRDIHFPQAAEYELYFDWKGGDENNFLTIQIADVNQIINAAASVPQSGILSAKRYGSAQWRHDTIIFKADQLVNSNQTLVFTWQNTGGGGTQLPIAIDNIELRAIPCQSPKGLTWVSFPETGKVEIKFVNEAIASSFDVNCYDLQTETNVVKKVNNINPTITGLSPKTNYEIKVKTICTGNDTSLWSDQINILMPQPFAQLPFEENFSDPNSVRNWSFINAPGSRSNKWFIGSASYYQASGDNQGLYIDSSSYGATNICSPVASVSHVYRDVEFPVSNSDFMLTFNWRSTGIVLTSEKWPTNYLCVSIIDIDKIPGQEQPVTDTITPRLFTEYEGWNNAVIQLPKSKYSGKKKRLVFTWHNISDITYLKQPPATVDNIKLSAPECSTPTNLTAKVLSHDSIQLTWKCLKTDTNNFVINYNYEGGVALNKTTTDTIIKISGLKSNTIYNITLLNECGGKNNTPVTVSAATLQKEALAGSFVEMFDNQTNISEWTFVNNGKDQWYAGIIPISEDNAPHTAAYISNTNGISNYYAGSASEKYIVHLYRDIRFDNRGEAVLQFDWRSVGNNSDMMKVYLADSNTRVPKDSVINDKYLLLNNGVSYFGLNDKWQNAFITIKGVKNTKKRLIFSWICDHKAPSNPPAAFGNLYLQTLDCQVPTTLMVDKYVSNTAVALKWDSVGTNYQIRYRKQGSPNWDTAYASNQNKDTLINLESYNIPYEAQIKNACNENSVWAPFIYFNTIQEPAMASYYDEFEEDYDRAKWTCANGKATNKWYIGKALSAPSVRYQNPSYSAYVSNDGGRTNTYSGDNPDKSIVHLYRDIEIPAGNKEFFLSFNWKAFGQHTFTSSPEGNPNDYMAVYLVDENFIPEAGKPIPQSSRLDTQNYYLYKHDWKKATIVYPIQGMQAGRKRLVFTWVNDNLKGCQPPIAIDNVHTDVSKCISPSRMAIYQKEIAPSFYQKEVGKDTVTLYWKYSGDVGTVFNIRIKEKGGNVWLEELMTQDTFQTIRNLTANTIYEVDIQANCNGSDTSFRIPATFQTLQEPEVFTGIYTENFENPVNRKAWTTVNGPQASAWFIGVTPGMTGGNNSAYISDSNGTTYRYQGEVIGSTSHIYRDFIFPSAPEYLVTFDWQGFGESEDYLIVSQMGTAQSVDFGTDIPQMKNISGKLYGNPDRFARTGARIKEDLSTSGVQRLIFSWKNDHTVVNQPPASIDNIEIKPLDCKTPEKLELVNLPDLHSAEFKWESTGDTFTIAYKKQIETNWSGMTGVRGQKSFVLTGLDSNTIYNVMVQNNCPQGPEILWSEVLSIKTLSTPARFNFIETFEDPNSVANWNIVNDTAVNRWTLGELDKAGKCIFISDDGTTNHYNHERRSIVHFYRDVYFPGSGSFELSFDWKSWGKANDLILKVGLADFMTDVVAGDTIKQSLGTYYSASATSAVWKTQKITLSDTLAGKKKRLVFTWRNQNNTNQQPPAAVDNIELRAFNCKSDSNFKLVTLSDKKIGLTWNVPSNEQATEHLIEWRKFGSSGSWKDTTVTNTACILSNLEQSSYYEIKLTLMCATGIGRFVADSVKTAYPMPYFDNIDTVSPSRDWNRRSIKLAIGGTTIIPASSEFSNWGSKVFAGVAEESRAARIMTSGTKNDWLITPLIDLGEAGNNQLEFKLSLTKNQMPEVPIDDMGTDDKLIVLLDTAPAITWSPNNILATWDNTGLNRDFNAISYTRKGDKIKIPLDTLKGAVRIAFYFESTINNSSNELYIDSVSVRPFVCEDVAELKPINVDYDNATIKWQATDENQYNWELRYGTTTNPDGMANNSVGETKYKLQALDTNQIYNVFVRAICKETLRSNWKSITFSTLSTCEKMDESSIAAIPTDTSAAITWGTTILHKAWELRYGTSDKTLEQMQRVFVATPSSTITGLMPETGYAYYLRAVCQNNDTSNWTDRKTFTTLKTPCAIVSNIVVANVQTNSATISWDAQPVQTKWELSYGGEGSTVNAMTLRVISQKTLTLTGLLAGTTYDFYIRSICSAGDTGAWSNKNQFNTRPCLVVDGLAVQKSENGNTAVLTWNKKEGQTSWMVSIAAADNSGDPKQEPANTPYLINYTTMGLDPYKNYNLAVQAQCGITSSSAWSGTILLPGKVGLEELNNNPVNINLAPNPANEYTTLSISGAEGKVTIQVYSVKGELFLTEKLTCTAGLTKEFTIKGLQRGAYTVRIVHENWTKTEKLIVN